MWVELSRTGADKALCKGCQYNGRFVFLYTIVTNTGICTRAIRGHTVMQSTAPLQVHTILVDFRLSLTSSTSLVVARQILQSLNSRLSASYIIYWHPSVAPDHCAFHLSRPFHNARLPLPHLQVSVPKGVNCSASSCELNVRLYLRRCLCY
jgi:hypothetical protein